MDAPPSSLYVNLESPPSQTLNICTVTQTHNLALAGPIADYIVSVSPEGIVSGRGNDLQSILARDTALQEDFQKDRVAIEEDAHIIEESKKATESDKPKDPVTDAGKLIVKEEVAHGNVGWKPIAVLIKAIGGGHVSLFFTLWIGVSIAESLVSSVKLWFMGYWSSQYEKFPVEQIPIVWYV